MVLPISFREVRAMPKITVSGHTWEVPVGTSLHTALREAGFSVDAPCGGHGRCGKCAVTVNGESVSTCQTHVREDMVVSLPRTAVLQTAETDIALKAGSIGFGLAFDIGTTSVAGYLLDGKTGKTLAFDSLLNPQTAYGADVISRIRTALGGQMDALQAAIRSSMTELAQKLCDRAGILPVQIEVVSFVGNCCMQQLFLGIPPENLARIPYAPVLTAAETVPAGDHLPICPNARLLIVPDIGGFVGADTVGCVLSTEMYKNEKMTLLVDIGTNGEMVLGSRERMIACSTAAGPALEGANIKFGMRAAEGAIDHVWLDDGALRCSVIGGGEPKGICGSGLIDAVAAGLEMGLLNRRGRIGNENRIFHITDTIYLTQDDIRQVQLAKGAIHAGICLMARQMGIRVEQIDAVLLAGAFGSYMDPASACRVGLLPEECAGRITPVGNAAGNGAKMLACDPELLALSQRLTERIEFLELASLPEFPRTFAKSMNFREVEP